MLLKAVILLLFWQEKKVCVQYCISVAFNISGGASEHQERLEQLEERELSPYAAAPRAGKEHHGAPCDMRTEYQRDRDRIIHSKSFRRLQFKPRCLFPEGGHYARALPIRWKLPGGPHHCQGAAA